MKRIFFILFALYFCLPSFGQEKISDNAQNLIDEFFDLRVNLATIEPEKTDTIISKIDEFSEKNKNKIDSLTEQEKLIIENFVIMEKYNYLYELPNEKKNQQKILGEQREKLEKFSKDKKTSELDKYFLCTQGDVTSCYMGFSLSDVLKYAMTIRPLYEKALEKDPNFSYALLNIGQWYYWAPGISGGSKKKTRTFFENAYNCSKTNAEKYYACISLSQILFEFKDFEKSKKLLEEAQTYCPESFYIKMIIEANKNNMSLFEYSRKKSSLDKEKK